MKKKRSFVAVIVVAALLLFLLFRNGYFNPERTKEFPREEQSREKPDNSNRTDKRESQQAPEGPESRRENFDRNTERIIYTRHARCRMGCRHIDEAEVREVLQNGVINYAESDLRSHPDPKYALEGTTRDRQKVRIIFAPSPRGMVVITVIDLGKEWSCSCD